MSCSSELFLFNHGLHLPISIAREKAGLKEEIVRYTGIIDWRLCKILQRALYGSEGIEISMLSKQPLEEGLLLLLYDNPIALSP